MSRRPGGPGRRGDVHGRWRRGAAAIVALGSLLAPSLGLAGPAAGARDPLDEAKRRIAEAERSAGQAAARYSEAYARHQQLESDIADAEQVIALAEQEVVRLGTLVRARAVAAYKSGRGASGVVGELAQARDAMDALRRTELLKRVNGRDRDVASAFSTARQDLAEHREGLEAARMEQRAVVEELGRQQEVLDARLEEARAEYARVEEQLRREEEQAREEARRRAAESARATSRNEPSSGGGRAGQVLGAPAPGGLVCPIQGPMTHTDDWGYPRAGGRRHQGNDLFSPAGTPNVAVVAGTLRQKYGATSGYGVRLHGDDGNLYYYFHLSSYEGPPRRVVQGEVVGYTGTTGDARGTSPHTHLEVHPGGGAAINPYPIVAGIC